LFEKGDLHQVRMHLSDNNVVLFASKKEKNDVDCSIGLERKRLVSRFPADRIRHNLANVLNIRFANPWFWPSLLRTRSDFVDDDDVGDVFSRRFKCSMFFVLQLRNQLV